MAVPRATMTRLADLDKVEAAESMRVWFSLFLAVTPALWSVLLSVPAYRNPPCIAAAVFLTVVTLLFLRKVLSAKKELAKDLVVIRADTFYDAIAASASDYATEQCSKTNAKICWLCRLLNRKTNSFR